MKNGGPYTKKQREERRNKVFKLHIEQGKSAVATSKILGVNRNTINEDIQFWNDKFNDDYLKYDYTSWVAKQFQRLESQRDRLIDQLKEEDTKNKLAIEDRIYRLDVKILEFAEKILKGKSKAEISTKDIDEDLVKRVTKFILLEKSAETTISEEGIEKYAITLLKYNSRKSMMVLSKMYELGLKLYKRERQYGESHTSDRYNLWEFAMARDYINEMEFEKREKDINYASR